MPEASQIVAAVLIILVAATVLSTVGFGLGITATPLLLLVLEPKTVVVLVVSVSALVFALIVVQARRSLPVRQMLAPSAAAVLGAPAGVLVLTAVSATVLRVSIAVVILALATAVVFNFRGAVPRPRVVGPLAGFATGGMVTALGIGGPIMALLLLGQGMQRQTLRVSLAFFFIAMSAMSLAGYAVAGLYTEDRLWLLLFVSVPALVGFGLGSVMLSRMNEAVFRRGVLTVTVVSSLLVLGREALSL